MIMEHNFPYFLSFGFRLLLSSSHIPAFPVPSCFQLCRSRDPANSWHPEMCYMNYGLSQRPREDSPLPEDAVVFSPVAIPIGTEKAARLFCNIASRVAVCSSDVTRVHSLLHEFKQETEGQSQGYRKFPINIETFFKVRFSR